MSEPAADRSLSVTIVNHNHWQWLQACLRSIEEHPYTLGTMEVIVLDNASEDGSVRSIRDQFPFVEIVERQIRRGFGENQNDAISQASGRYVFVLNPDAVVYENTLDALVESFTWDESVCIAAGPDTGSEVSRPITSPFPFPSPENALKRAIGLGKLGEIETPREACVTSTEWVSGHAFMVDSRRFSRVGGFDQSFFLYSEEVDLMKRMLGRGWKIAWVPEAKTTHIGKTSEIADTGSEGQATGYIGTRTWVQFARSEILYVRKHHGKASRLAFRIVSSVDAAMRYLVTYVPWLRCHITAKGPSLQHTRRHHATRVRVFSGLPCGPDMESHAREWNRKFSENALRDGEKRRDQPNDCTPQESPRSEQ